MKEKFIIVFSTCSSEKEAKKISDALLKSRASACVNAVRNIESRYWWKGKIESGREILLIIKTRKSLYPKVEQIIIKNHSYDTPEIVSVPVEKGSEKYLRWILEETNQR